MRLLANTTRRNPRRRILDPNMRNMNGLASHVFQSSFLNEEEAEAEIGDMEIPDTACEMEIEETDSENDELEARMWPGRAWYNLQHHSDLKQFIIQRKTKIMLSGDPMLTSHLHKILKWMSRDDLVDALIAQDKAMQIPFFRLPAELRNKVYTILLVDPCQHTDIIDKPRINCYPSILGVCKKINKEAWNVLYANAFTTLNLTFSSTSADDRFDIDCIRPIDSPFHGNPFSSFAEEAFGSSTTSAFRTRRRRPSSYPITSLYNPIIKKVGNVNIRITIATRSAWEQVDHIQQVVSDLKDYMAANNGQKQHIRILFDLMWEGDVLTPSSEAYKRNPHNKKHIITVATQIMTPFTEFGNAKKYAHLLACQNTEVEFMVADDIPVESVEALDGMRKNSNEELEKEILKTDYLYETAEQMSQREIIGQVTEKIIKKHWREDQWGAGSDDEDDKAYMLSPKKKVCNDTNLWDDDEMGKDDDSVHFDSDEEEEMEDDDGNELPFDLDDVEDEDFVLDDLIQETAPAKTIEFHPDIMEDREIKEWIKNGGFDSEENKLRDARVAYYDPPKKGKEDNKTKELFGN